MIPDACTDGAETDSDGADTDGAGGSVPFDIITDALQSGDGCYVAPHCLACPLAQCIYDVPPVMQRRISIEAHVIALRDAGYTIKEIVVIVGRARRTVHRMISTVKARKSRQNSQGVS